LASYDLEYIVDTLNKYRQKATYGAVAGVLGRLPIGLMNGRQKCHKDSWIVSASTGFPTGYEKEYLHPDWNSKKIIIKSYDKLLEWLSMHPR
jgi:hypothetical protein